MKRMLSRHDMKGNKFFHTCIRKSRFLRVNCFLTSKFNCAAIDAPGGFLFEWWSVFWDIFIARTNEKHSEPAAAYIEVSV